MAEKRPLKSTTSVEPTNGTEKMAKQIDEMYNRFNLIENLVADLMPGLEKIPRELHDTISELREKFERDETIKLIKQVGDNIPTFVELLDVMKAMKGLIADLAPAAEKIPEEIAPTVRELREKFERDETLKLVKLVGDNIPTFVSLLDVMGAVKGLVEDLAPATEKITKEIMPTIRTLRESLEKDVVLEILRKTGENLPTFNKLLDFLTNFEEKGNLDFTIQTVMTKETDYLMRGLQNSAVVTMKQFEEQPFESGLRKIFSSLRNPEVQKGFVFFFTLIGNMYVHIIEEISEIGAGEGQKK